MKSPKVVVIALDANLANTGADKFRTLSVSAKLAALENHIIDICEELKTTAPESLWLMAWCETAIETYIAQLALSPDDKKIFKATFKGLTARYPNLAIVAGSIQTYKNTTDLNKVDKILQDYQFLKKFELVEALSPYSFIKNEREKVIKAIANNAYFTIIRNSCFVFYRKTVWCHDKSAPVRETHHNDHLLSPIFQPPKKKTLNPICKLMHPVTYEEIKIGIEICNEHWFSYLKDSASNDPIYLHLVLSGTIPLRHSYLVGKYTIQLDARKKPVLILAENEDIHNLPIQYYQSNFFMSKDPLVGPLKPVYPLIKNILTKLDSAIRKLPDGVNKNGLKSLRANISVHMFVEVIEDNKDAIALLETQLHVYRHYFVNKHTINSLYPPSPDLVQLLDELNTLVKNDKVNNPFYSDIHPRDDAPLLT